MPTDSAKLVARLAGPAIALALAGCEGVQSSLAPAGSEARAIATIFWPMLVGGAAIFGLVIALTLWATFAPAGWRGWLGGKSVIVVGGIVFPVITLSALLVYSLALAGGLLRLQSQAPVDIEVTGEMWWWRVNYLDADGETLAAAANEVHVPVGRPVKFRLASGDVIHSFWVPKLGGKLDMIPGRVNDFVLRAEREGVYRGQCAEYCGAQHALMAFEVFAHEPAAFEAWLAAEAESAAAPADPFLLRGRDLFMTNGCGGCHAIRGTKADGTFGPDLTHVGGRRMIAAATLPNNVGTLAAWISDSQHIKPRNRMPSYNVLTGEELRAMAAYLANLK